MFPHRLIKSVCIISLTKTLVPVFWNSDPSSLQKLPYNSFSTLNLLQDETENFECEIDTVDPASLDLQLILQSLWSHSSGVTRRMFWVQTQRSHGAALGNLLRFLKVARSLYYVR